MMTEQAALAEARAELREWQEWSNELAGLIAGGDEAEYANPEGAQEAVILDCFRAYVSQLDAIRALHGPDRPLHLGGEGVIWCNHCGMTYPCPTARLLGASDESAPVMERTDLKESQ